MSDDRNAGDGGVGCIAGIAFLGCLAVGIGAVGFAIAKLEKNAVAAGLGFVAAAISFGIVLMVFERR